ncbi:MAG: RNase adapter RapZ [Acidobacteria bacterium]|nr:MAG: RNase adapter RapZ [Acidobacteriota bacterium]
MKRLVLVSGLSGSGKTLAMKSLEDLGYFTVDNLPVALIPPFIELLERGGDEEPRAAFVADAREREHLVSLPALVQELRDRPDVSLTVIFLEAAEDVLVRRFSESRRPHPLAQNEPARVAEAIRREVELLAPVRALADRIIVTDDLSPHDLRRLIRTEMAGPAASSALRCHVVSFGFKHGLPRDADMVFDVRFVPNPYFRPALKPLTGSDRPVVEFLESQPVYRGFLERVEALLAFVMPRFVEEGKSVVTIAVGCTGGQHRSVAAAERIAAFLRREGYDCAVTHRDVERERRTS